MQFNVNHFLFLLLGQIFVNVVIALEKRDGCTNIYLIDIHTEKSRKMKDYTLKKRQRLCKEEENRKKVER